MTPIEPLGEGEPSENQIAWLKDCNIAGFDPVMVIQELRDEVTILRAERKKYRSALGLLSSWNTAPQVQTIANRALDDA